MMIRYGLVALLGVAGMMQAQAQTTAAKAAGQERKVMTVTGTFDVKVTPQKPDNAPAEAAGLGRMSIDKVFHGGIEGTSKGEMLAAMSAVKGSAGYVAMERATATVGRKSGSFVLQHTGTMDKGVSSLSVTVVPDSGTGELMGIAGSMTIDIADGKHSYRFSYTLP